MRFVSVLAVLFSMLFSAAALAQNETVTIQGIDPGEEVRVAINARTSSGQACLKDIPENRWGLTKADTLGRVSVGNLASGCVLTIAAFSRKRAMLLETLSGWKDEGGETRTVTMQAVIDVPIFIWITHDDLDSLARRQVAAALQLYENNMVGIRFVPTFNNVSKDSDKVLRIELAVEPRPGTEGSTCARVDLLPGHAYQSKALNVYYVNRGGLHRNCAIRETPDPETPVDKTQKADGNVTYLGPEDMLPNLAHELGHAFGLRPIIDGGHPNLDSGFTPENIMHGAGGSIRKSFSLGQVFRMNMQQDRWGGTMMIANELRPGPGRECHLAPNQKSTHLCPPMNLGLEE